MRRTEEGNLSLYSPRLNPDYRDRADIPQSDN